MFGATLCINVVRPDGLLLPLESASRQVFNGSWELLVVNWFMGEQDELLRALWGRLRPDVPLQHVRPLPPLPVSPPGIPEGSYGSWCMGTTFNTGWTHARGEIFVHTEDFWCFRKDWLQNHVDHVRKYPNRLSLGHNHDAPLLDDSAPYHYGVEAVILDNFSHYTKLAWADRGLGAPEWPTRHPETSIMPHVLPEYVRVPNAPAWHQAHYPDGAPAQVMQKVSYVPGEAYYHPDGASFDGMWRYTPVARMGNNEAYNHALSDHPTPYRRNIRDERQNLGLWT